ncbi:MAG TPA: hypothetical protein DCS43_12240, partial [Verrucomicrobia bacterium]|nr:hypothetical protein [Verrucomicrobiota bacterium]
GGATWGAVVINPAIRCECASETVIKTHLLDNGHVGVKPDGYDRERAIFPVSVLVFPRSLS